MINLAFYTSQDRITKVAMGLLTRKSFNFHQSFECSGTILCFDRKVNKHFLMIRGFFAFYSTIVLLWSFSISTFRDNAFWNWFTYLTTWSLIINTVYFHCIAMLHYKIYKYFLIAKKKTQANIDIYTNTDTTNNNNNNNNTTTTATTTNTNTTTNTLRRTISRRKSSKPRDDIIIAAIVNGGADHETHATTKANSNSSSSNSTNSNCNSNNSSNSNSSNSDGNISNGDANDNVMMQINNNNNTNNTNNTNTKDGKTRIVADSPIDSGSGSGGIGVGMSVGRGVGVAGGLTVNENYNVTDSEYEEKTIEMNESHYNHDSVTVLQIIGFPSIDDDLDLRGLWNFSYFFCDTGITTAIFVTLLFWFLVYDGRDLIKLNPILFNTHGLLCFFVIFDWMTSCWQTTYMGVVTTFLIGAAWIVLSLAFYSAGNVYCVFNYICLLRYFSI